MRKAAIVLFLLILAGVCFGETLKIGYFELEPYVINGGEGKTPTGASVEYWEKYIAPKMKVESEWIAPLPMLRLLASLEDGEIDVVIVIAKNPDREKRFLFSENPYLTMKPSLVFLKNNPLSKISKIDDIFGMTIGYQEGAFMPPIMKNDKITIDFAKNTDYKKTNFDKLLAKRIDAILDVNDVSNVYTADKMKIWNQMKILLLPTDPTSIFTLFAKTDKGARLKASYDAVNNTLYKTKTFENLLKKFLPK
jgi:ABC-type amino acid transport substrate-binding protein